MRSGPLGAVWAVVCVLLFAVRMSSAQGASAATESTISPKENMCAASCAYTILKLEGVPNWTVSRLMSELPGADIGAVRLHSLARLLERNGMSVRAVKGLGINDLRRVPNDRHLYVMPMMAVASTDQENPIDHISLFVRIAQDRTYLFVDGLALAEREQRTYRSDGSMVTLFSWQETSA